MFAMVHNKFLTFQFPHKMLSIIFKCLQKTIPYNGKSFFYQRTSIDNKLIKAKNSRFNFLKMKKKVINVIIEG